MSAVFTIMVWLIVVAAAAPAFVLFVETLASFLPLGRQKSGETPLSIAVVVPAHNESCHIKQTLDNISEQLRETDRLIVVADNCTDDTAAVAKRCGAQIIIRDAPDRRGKGYALQFAIDHLGEAPPDCIVFLDADCLISKNAIQQLAAIATGNGRPAQALYLMAPPEDPSPRDSVAAFAWVMVNRVRMAGLSAIGDVTRFTGAGLALPWACARKLDFGGGDITEDLVMSLKMAKAKIPATFAPTVTVTSRFPGAFDASVTQRARWEHGSLSVLATRAIPSLASGVSHGDPRLVLLALDALIPPLVVLAAVLIAALLVSAAAIPLSGAAPFFMAFFAVGLFAVTLTASWIRYGRDMLPLEKLWALAPFLLQKIKIYGNRGRESSKTWTRTDRDGEGGEAK